MFASKSSRPKGLSLPAAIGAAGALVAPLTIRGSAWFLLTGALPLATAIAVLLTQRRKKGDPTWDASHLSAATWLATTGCLLAAAIVLHNGMAADLAWQQWVTDGLLQPPNIGRVALAVLTGTVGFGLVVAILSPLLDEPPVEPFDLLKMCVVGAASGFVAVLGMHEISERTRMGQRVHEVILVGSGTVRNFLHANNVQFGNRMEFEVNASTSSVTLWEVESASGAGLNVMASSRKHGRELEYQARLPVVAMASRDVNAEDVGTDTVGSQFVKVWVGEGQTRIWAYVPSQNTKCWARLEAFQCPADRPDPGIPRRLAEETGEECRWVAPSPDPTSGTFDNVYRALISAGQCSDVDLEHCYFLAMGGDAQSPTRIAGRGKAAEPAANELLLDRLARWRFSLELTSVTDLYKRYGNVDSPPSLMFFGSQFEFAGQSADVTSASNQERLRKANVWRGPALAVQPYYVVFRVAPPDGSSQSCSADDGPCSIEIQNNAICAMLVALQDRRIGEFRVIRFDASGCQLQRNSLRGFVLVPEAANVGH